MQILHTDYRYRIYAYAHMISNGNFLSKIVYHATAAGQRREHGGLCGFRHEHVQSTCIGTIPCNGIVPDN
jgi:hypothetical protein